MHCSIINIARDCICYLTISSKMFLFIGNKMLNRRLHPRILNTLLAPTQSPVSIIITPSHTQKKDRQTLTD